MWSRSHPHRRPPRRPCDKSLPGGPEENLGQPSEATVLGWVWGHTDDQTMLWRLEGVAQMPAEVVAGDFCFFMLLYQCPIDVLNIKMSIKPTSCELECEV